MELPDPHIGIVLNVGDKKHLFLDDNFIVETSVRVRPAMHSPVKKGPVLFPDKPWERGASTAGRLSWRTESSRCGTEV